MRNEEETEVQYADDCCGVSKQHYSGVAWIHLSKGPKCQAGGGV